MADEFDFASVGGVPQVQGNGDLAWNFGLRDPAPGVATDDAPPPFFHDRFPNLQGRWDGKTSVNHHDAVRKVLGRDLTAHRQRIGSCGGHAGSRALEVLQCVLIAAGKRAEFKPASHAWIYYLARKDGQMLGSGDGVPGGSVGPVLERYGALTRDEADDPYEGGTEVDQLAASWGAGRMDREALDRLLRLAADNLVTARVRVRSAQELADAIASGGVCVCSDMQGYTMQRDAEGLCQPYGQWAHYHVRSGVGVTPRGRKRFAYDQSWGEDAPSGPRLDGYPGNCFGVEYSVQDRVIRSRWAAYDVLLGFDLWDMEKGIIPDLPWGM